MARARRLPFVRVRVLRSGERRYQATKRLDGVRRYGPLRETPEAAYEDACALQRDAARAAQRESAPTFDDALAMTEDELVAKRAPQTVKWFRGQCKVLRSAWAGELPLDRISTAGIEAFIRKRLAEVSPNTVRQHLAALRRVLRLAVKRGRLQVNPIESVDPPRAEEPQMDCFAPEEVAALAADIEARGAGKDADLIRFVFLTGLRRAEVARLQVADVDLVVGVVRVRGKTGRREVPVGDELRPVASRMLDRARPPVFFGTVDAIAGVFKRWQAALHEPRLHAHTLRHAFATALIRAGHDADTVRRLLGHRSLTMLTRYLHGHGPAARAAIASLRLRPGTQGEARSSAQA